MKTLFLVLSLLAVGIFSETIYDDADGINVEVTYEQVPKKEDEVVKPWKKHDFKKREPEFLKDMSQDAKTAYFGIKYNPELTKAEKTQKLKEFAETYDVEDDMKKFLEDKKADCDKKKKERKENYDRLGDLIDKADDILEDESNTWNGANEKLEALIKEDNRDVQKAFQTFYPFVGREDGPKGKHGHGHRFHHGKRFGRHIGGGAAPRPQGIGSGIGFNEPRHGGQQSYDAYGNKRPEFEQREHHHKKHHGF
ncbi:hypothetical protein CAEBREN_28649 [Caenorhabditis brenneri]|uniref:SXP/RAL-2 family protein Ani s 5-like cation-binding domain-containing protein n=1 Tax=Caenorhabditis brenneri TaxID=135651 RepID=G0P4B1_CAEBE|nr:hypothetical protein CAEBREN_28649 [Caenorhabditis brenneri]